MERKLSYDSEQDILYFNEGRIVQDSLEIGNMYIEFSADNKVAGVEVLNASEFISDFTGEEFSKETLGNILDAEIKVIRSGDFVVITLQFVAEKEGQKVKESIGVNVPSQTVTA